MPLMSDQDNNLESFKTPVLTMLLYTWQLFKKKSKENKVSFFKKNLLISSKFRIFMLLGLLGDLEDICRDQEVGSLFQLLSCSALLFPD